MFLLLNGVGRQGGDSIFDGSVFVHAAKHAYETVAPLMIPAGLLVILLLLLNLYSSGIFYGTRSAAKKRKNGE